MDVKGFIYAAKMTNALAKEIPESSWDTPLIRELGTLRKLFIHIIRVRNVYRNGLETGVVQFPGELPSSENIKEALEKSMEELATAFLSTEGTHIKMAEEELSIAELLATAIQHEGIHQGQYYVALKQKGMYIPDSWKKDWGM
ncbi:DinB family protein [Evansella cellulosilytica]|uniref:DinB family protein n=1 Tax=Evansella cellulosilytica (strain ATCC 21833 / DSM 2522 / FERM P-1141 / JCM 9156 / N-4) TaxID=649639 RepID=E6TWF6_EVAC2|nr:DinB family protein [Evansella cellulosilytica]ADU32219.1 DinB family protein [Evansella cellulosilytica DSM 2522]